LGESDVALFVVNGGQRIKSFSIPVGMGVRSTFTHGVRRAILRGDGRGEVKVRRVK